MFSSLRKNYPTAGIFLTINGLSQINRIAVPPTRLGRPSLAGLRRILKVAPVNTVAARRRIADAVTERRAYVFGLRA